MSDLDMTALQADLIRDEGLRTSPYRDTVGKLTIGVGRNLSDVGISRDEAQYLLENDIGRTMADLDRDLPWWRHLPPGVARGLVNMAFNIGGGALLGFHQMLDALERGSWAEAATQAKASLWARQVGARADRIAALFEGGA